MQLDERAGGEGQDLGVWDLGDLGLFGMMLAAGERPFFLFD